jgi:hypothetical protein
VFFVAMLVTVNTPKSSSQIGPTECVWGTLPEGFEGGPPGRPAAAGLSLDDAGAREQGSSHLLDAVGASLKGSKEGSRPTMMDSNERPATWRVETDEGGLTA